jgi:AcrR family transcriptional regulator
MAVQGKTKHEVLSAFRTAEILSAARKVFAEKGFNDATMDQIAEAGGLSKGTVYLYFPSKRDVYLAALMHGAQELGVLTAQRMAAAEGFRAKIRAFFQTRLQYLEENRDFFQIYHSEFGNIMHPVALCQDFRDLYLKNLVAFEAVLKEGLEAGEIRASNLPTIASAIYDMAKGTMMRRLIGPTGTSVDEDVETLTDLAWKGISN